MNLAVFDIDGTLVDSYPVEDELFVRTFEELFGVTGIDDEAIHVDAPDGLFDPDLR